MTAIDDFPLVCILAYEGLCTFEFGIATELFALPRPELQSWYRYATVAEQPGLVEAMGGVKVTIEYDLSLLNQANLIVIPGWTGIDVPVPETVKEALRLAYNNGARVASICSGVFVLAASGLLAGKHATTHWRYVDELARRYHDITVKPDVLFVEDDRVYSSAGSAAGLDMGLHIIRQDYGAKVAASVARRLVLPAQRDGGQRQFVPRPEPKARFDSTIAHLQDKIRETLSEHWPLKRMAQVAHVSERTLSRRFLDETGTSAHEWLRAERAYRAAELLENSSVTLDDVCASSGFGSAETFRREFRKTIGVSPSKYRERFGSLSCSPTP